MLACSVSTHVVLEKQRPLRSVELRASLLWLDHEVASCLLLSRRRCYGCHGDGRVRLRMRMEDVVTMEVLPVCLLGLSFAPSSSSTFNLILSSLSAEIHRSPRGSSLLLFSFLFWAAALRRQSPLAARSLPLLSPSSFCQLSLGRVNVPPSTQPTNTSLSSCPPHPSPPLASPRPPARSTSSTSLAPPQTESSTLLVSRSSSTTASRSTARPVSSVTLSRSSARVSVGVA